MELVGVRILVGLLWNSTWLEPGTTCDMPKDRATDLANSTPRKRDCPPDHPEGKGFLEILPELTGREIVPAPVPSGPITLDAGDNPRQPATLNDSVATGTAAGVDTLSDCPAKDKLAVVAITSLDQLRGMLTVHGDGFAKVLKLSKDEAKAIAEWVAAQPAAV